MNDLGYFSSTPHWDVAQIWVCLPYNLSFWCHQTASSLRSLLYALLICVYLHFIAFAYVVLHGTYAKHCSLVDKWSKNTHEYTHIHNWVYSYG